MRIEELSQATGVTVRTIREYISHGLLRRPEGRTRNSYYTDEHRRELLQIKALMSEDCSLDRTALVMGERRRRAAEAAEPAKPGVEGSVSPGTEIAAFAGVQTVRISSGLLLVFSDPLVLREDDYRDFSKQVLNCYTRYARKSRMALRASSGHAETAAVHP